MRRAGLSCPGDVSVVGFDDSALMNCTDPALTTVRQPIEPMGRVVIELLAGTIDGTAVPHDELLFEPELVVRGSTATVAADRAASGRLGSSSVYRDTRILSTLRCCQFALSSI